jgi:hypothetical protein
MNPNTLEEEINDVFYYDTFLANCQDGHLREPINNSKYTIITMRG